MPHPPQNETPSPDKAEIARLCAARRTASGKPAATKKVRLIAMLGAKNGAKVSNLCKALGWQGHSVRAALSGLRRQGYMIETTWSARDGITVYRISVLPGAAL